jgi:hypothetical protein
MVVDAGILDPDGSGAGPSEAANSRPSIRAGWMEIGEIMPGKHPAEIPTATAFWFLGCASLSCGGDNQRMLNPTSLNSDLNVQVTDKQPFNPNSEAGTALVGGGRLPACHVRQTIWEKSPAASRQQLTGKMPVPLPSANAGFGVRVQ